MTCNKEDCTGCHLEDLPEPTQESIDEAQTMIAEDMQQEEKDPIKDIDKMRPDRLLSLAKIDKVLQRSGIKGSLSRGDIAKIQRELRNLAALHEQAFQGLMADIFNFAKAMAEELRLLETNLAMSHLGSIVAQKFLIEKGIVTEDEFKAKWMEMAKQQQAAEEAQAAEEVASQPVTENISEQLPEEKKPE